VLAGRVTARRSVKVAPEFSPRSWQVRPSGPRWLSPSLCCSRARRYRTIR